MKFFADTADIQQIQKLLNHHLVDGVTTNPSLMARQGEKDPLSLIKSLCELAKGPVSAEVVEVEEELMYREALSLSSVHPLVVVKLPLTGAGLKVCRRLAAKKIKTNMTLCFNPLQALMAARMGASMVSIFVGRLDDTGVRGMKVAEEVIKMFVRYSFSTQVLVASVRTLSHVQAAALGGADIVTLPPALFSKLIHHPLTDKGLNQFLKDYKNSKKNL